MQVLELFKIFTKKLSELDINYVVTGSVATIIFGEPSLTNDIDLVVKLFIKDLRKLTEAFPSNEHYCPPEDIIKVGIIRFQRGHFILIHHQTGFKADIYLVGRVPFLKWAIENAVEIDITGVQIKLAPLEYVIIKKLEYFREGNSRNHLIDISSMVNISGERINMELLNNYIDKFALRKEWEYCLNFNSF